MTNFWRHNYERPDNVEEETQRPVYGTRSKMNNAENKIQ